MHRALFSFALFLHIVVALLFVVQASIFSMIGEGMYYLGPYSTWLRGLVLFFAIQGVVVLKYLEIKNLTIAFWTVFTNVVLAVLLLLINYSMMDIGYGTQLYIPVSSLTLLSQVVSGTCLFITAPRENIWLKITGIYTGLLGITTLFLSIVVVSGKFIEYHAAIDSLNAPLAWAAVIIPLLMAMNFYRELQAVPKENVESPAVYTFGYPIVAMAALYLTMSFLARPLE